VGSLNLGLQVHLLTCSIPASECISDFTQSWPPSTSLSPLDHGLQVHLSPRSITASKYIVNYWRRVYWDTGVTEVDWAMGSTNSGDPTVDRHHIIFTSSYQTTKIHTLSFSTLGLTRSFRDLVDPRNCIDSHGLVVSYLLTFFLDYSSKHRSFTQILFVYWVRCGGMLMVGPLPSCSVVSPQWPPSGADYARLPSLARLTVCIYTEILKYCMPYYEVVNHVTVRKMNTIYEMPCDYRTLRVASGLIHILLMYPMNPFWHLAIVGHHTIVFVYNSILTEREQTAKLRSKGDMRRNSSDWCRTLPIALL